jgi:hypothetical protein
MTLNRILFRDRWLNRNYKRDYRIIFINILLLPAKQLGEVAAIN